jgi:hypothetical protein
MKNRCLAPLILLAISLQGFSQTQESSAAKGLEGVWRGTRRRTHIHR